MQLVVAIIVGIIIYVLQQRIYLRLWNKELDVYIKFHDSYVNAGESSYLTEVINNAKSLPMPVFHVKFSTSRTFKFDDCRNTSITDAYHRNDVFSVMGNQKISRKLSFNTSRRGLYSVDNINIIAKDFFMTRTFAMSIDNHTEMYVFPKKLKGPDFDVVCNNIMGDIEVKNNMIEDPYTFRGIRAYDRCDSMSRINWKATARTNELMVNMYNHSSEQQIKILLNMDTNSMIKTDYLQEIGIEFASSVAEYFISKNIPVSIASNAKDIVTGESGTVEAGSSASHLVTIEKYLARINGNRGVDVFLEIVNREIREADIRLSYVVISSYYREDLLIKLDYMIKMGIAVSMVVPYYDIQKPDFTRDYIHGWEVHLNET